MFSLATLVITSTVTFVFGYLLGLIVTRSLSKEAQKSRTLNARLEQAEQDLSQYQQKVTEHFGETAQLVSKLTQSYKDVHEHLANNALSLANVDISRQLLSSQVSKNGDTFEVDEEDIAPPKDWAPGGGSLSEDYGLKPEEASTMSSPK